MRNVLKPIEKPETDLPLVLLHGLGVDHRMWDPVRHVLQETGPVWSPDLPGFGLSPPLPPARRTVEGYAAWLLGELDRRFEGPVCLAGYSMGGTLALQAALSAPGKVAALALCCTSACWGAGMRRWLGLAFARIGGMLSMEIFQCSVRWSIVRHTGLPQAREVARDMTARADRPTMRALYVELARIDLRPRLGGVGVRTMVVAGTRDWLAPPSHARVLGRGIPRAEIRWFRGAGHLLCASHAERFGRELRAFWTGVRGAEP